MKIRVFALVLFGIIVHTSLPAQEAVVRPWKDGKVKMRVQDGDDVKDIKVDLQFKQDRLEIYTLRKGHATLLKSLPYAQIEGADYSVEGVDLPGPSFLTKSQKHWLTIRCLKDAAFLRLDKTNHKGVRQRFTDRTGVPVKATARLSSDTFHWPASF
jgi:hypothetical protein